MTLQEWLGADNTLGQDIWQKKYQHNNETLDEWFDRVSGGNEMVKQLIKEKKFIFGGRILANRGLEKEGRKITYSNCYVLAPPEDNIESIFDTAKKLARTFSYGGGVGIDIGKLSPAGAMINNAAKETSGAVSFMDLYSMVTGLIGQAGRRGALMISIPCTHPDLLDFIGIKSDLNRVTKANISVRITDDFMVAVKNRKSYLLSFVREETGEHIIKEVDAYEVFRKLCEENWNNAEPGMLFWDTIKNNNILSADNDFSYAGVNPCFDGSMMLLTTDGYRTFEELCDTEPYIINVNGNVTKTKVWCSGEKDTVRIKTGRGDIICTPDHVFMTTTGDECMAKDLKGKKIMPCTRFNNIFDDRFIKYGFIQGDGQLTRLNSPRHKGLEVNIGKKDTDIVDLFANEKYTIQSERSIYLYGFNEDLFNLGFCNAPLPERRLPLSYDNWTDIQKRSFLRGCYSANGSVIKKGRISYKTTCLGFANELVATLLDDFGIAAYVTTNKKRRTVFANGEYECKESYDVNICRFKDITLFAALIGFQQQYKREQMSMMIASKATHVFNVIPNGKRKVYDFTESETHWGVVEGCVVHNCAEEPLPAGGSCLLGSLNLAEFVDEEKKVFDFSGFRHAVAVAVIGLNEVLDEGLKLHPLQEQQESVRDWRQIGLGIFGLADAMIKMGVRYGSIESIDLCDAIGSAMANQAIYTSATLANKYDVYPKYDYEKVMGSGWLNRNMIGDQTRGWVEMNGLRNSQLLTCAPTGSLSSMFGVSGGIEPIFANYYTRKTETLHGHDEYYKVYTPIVKKYMEEHGFKDDSELPNYFVTAQIIDYKDRIAMQAVWQKHIDASISSTINLPNSATVEDVEQIYMLSWEKGLKGVTIFRDGCRRTGILTTDNKEENADNNSLKRGDIVASSDDLVGKKRKLITGCGSLHCEAFFDPESGELRETYFSKGSTGGCASFMVGLSRMISLAARGGVPLEKIVDQLQSCTSCPSYAVRRATKHDTSLGNCCPMAIGNALVEMSSEMKKEIESGKKTTVVTVKTEEIHKDDVCPECGNKLVHEGGCNSCPACGYTKCD